MINNKYQKSFTLVELLVIVVILAIVLAIAIASFSKVIENARRNAFNSDVLLVTRGVSHKMTENEELNLTIINETNIEDILGISAVNYQSVEVIIIEEKLYIIIVGKNRWSGLSGYGTLDYISTGIRLVDIIDESMNPIDDNDYFVGPNPNNWLQFGQVSVVDDTPIMWRIIKKDSEGIKIVYEGIHNGINPPGEDGRITIGGSLYTPYDETGSANGSNKWDRPADLKSKLLNWYEDDFYADNKEIYVQPINWCIGGHDWEAEVSDIESQTCINQTGDGGFFKGMTTNKYKVGMINVFDYIRTSSAELCFSTEQTICGSAYNFLHKPEYRFWTLNSPINLSSSVSSIHSDGSIYHKAAFSTTVSVRPVINLRSSIIFKGGNGTLSDPYIIK